MKVGLGILSTFMISFFLAFFTPNMAKIMFTLPMILLITIGEIFVIYRIGQKVHKLDTSHINLYYSLFILLNGFGLTYIYFFFAMNEIIFAAAAAGVFFLSMGIYGYFSKQNLSAWSSILKSAFLAIFTISVLHMLISFFTGQRSSLIDLLVSIAMIIVLSLHTAYEMNNYKYFFSSASDTRLKNGIVTLGAVNLYLNYMVIFKHILRIMRYTNNNNRK
jgi:FtsH-binding integral membrane protein